MAQLTQYAALTMSIIKKLTVGATIAAIGVYALSNRKKAAPKRQAESKAEPAELATATAKTKTKPKPRKRAMRTRAKHAQA